MEKNWIERTKAAIGEKRTEKITRAVENRNWLLDAYAQSLAFRNELNKRLDENGYGLRMKYGSKESSLASYEQFKKDLDDETAMLIANEAKGPAVFNDRGHSCNRVLREIKKHWEGREMNEQNAMALTDNIIRSRKEMLQEEAASFEWMINRQCYAGPVERKEAAEKLRIKRKQVFKHSDVHSTTRTIIAIWGHENKKEEEAVKFIEGMHYMKPGTSETFGEVVKVDVYSETFHMTFLEEGLEKKVEEYTREGLKARIAEEIEQEKRRKEACCA